MKYYFAYGSNLNVKQMDFRCPGAKRIGTALLKNWQLSFNGKDGEGYLTIEPAKGKSVPIGVWQVNEENELSLDRYEGYPSFYFKEEMDLMVSDMDKKPMGTIKGFVYIMNEKYGSCLCTKRYYDTCIKGYEDFGFDVKILEDAYQRMQEQISKE